MKDMTTQALYTKERSYKVLDDLAVNISMEENVYNLLPENIFSLAARNNPKRSFLFVSKLIGKHIPVGPQIPFITGFLLASRLAQTLGISVNEKKIKEAVNYLKFDHEHSFQRQSYNLPGKTLFIGFAETATALGHSVFDSFSGNIQYLHTTREDIQGCHDTIYFTEDHCHAPDQRTLIDNVDMVKDNDLVVLIDDEITTGNTCLNIIKTIQAKYSQKKYKILTILDWRSESSKEKYSQAEKQLGIQIEVLSIFNGRFRAEGTSPVINDSLVDISGEVPSVNMLHIKMDFKIERNDQNGKKDSYLRFTGRFGIDEKDNNSLYVKAREIGENLFKIRKGNKTLCLGTGEFMYIPFLISLFMGNGVLVQSTTRSPVHPRLKEDYAVNYAITFEDPFRPGIKNFVYNIPPNYYDEVFVFWEKKVSIEQVTPLVQSFKQLGIENITFVNFSN